MSPTVASSILNPIARGKAVNNLEFDSILNVFPEPALLYDRTRNQVVAVNLAFIKHTFYSQNEMVGRPVEDLVSGWDPNQDISLEPIVVVLNRRSRESAATLMYINALDAIGQWYLLTFSDSKYANGDLSEFYRKSMVGYIDLFQPMGAVTADVFINKAVALISVLLEVDTVCVYQAAQQYPVLNKIAESGRGLIFPESIPSTDLIRLSNTTLWQLGKRVQTEIHRSGRIAKMALVGSAAIGEKGALSGLLVIGSSDQSNQGYIEETITVWANLIRLGLENLILVENLRIESQDTEKRLSIYENLFEINEQGVFILGSDLNIDYINPTAETMLGYLSSEVHNQKVENVLIGPDRLSFSLEEAQNGKATHDLGNAYLHRRNGQAFLCEIQTLPVMRENEVISIMVFITDKTEDEQNRVRTQQLEQRAFLGDFTAIFAHEVRNPINNISTGLQLMAALIDPQDPNQEVINRMMGDCTRLNHLMDSILSFSRPMDIKLEPIDINRLLTRILDRWYPRFTRVNVTHYFQSDDNLPFVNGDPRALEQVFTNLISNAIEAMSKTGGTLAIRAKMGAAIADRPQIEVTVSDSGPGIPDEVKDRIFEPFITTNPRGNGLGLAITKRIVTAHRGSIGVNTFPGGTVFYINLPAVNGEP